jgi:hypothetical protein
MPHPRWDEKADRRWTSDTLSSNRTRQGARKDRFVKKNSTVKRNLKKGATKTTKDIQESITIGVDVGDKTSRYCVLNGTGEVKEEGRVPTSKKGMMQMLSSARRCRIAIEVGPHSPWVSRLLSGLGHEVIVANARQVKLISTSSRKNDRLDAQVLARLARMDPQLLRPIHHRNGRCGLCCKKWNP